VIKPPRLPHPGSPLEARYTKEQMRAYAFRAMEVERQACAELCAEVLKHYEKRAKASSSVTTEHITLARLICENIAKHIQQRKEYEAQQKR
jgi:predicted nucleic acid-binding Zn ribbon protein